MELLAQVYVVTLKSITIMIAKEIIRITYDLICRRYYVIVPLHLEVLKEENLYKVKFMNGHNNSCIDAILLCWKEIQVIYDAIQKSKHTSAHSIAQWRAIFTKVKEWEAEK